MKEANIDPIMENNMFALKLNQHEKKNKVYQANESYLKILKTTIGSEQLSLDTFEDRKKEGLKQIEKTFTDILAKIIKEPKVDKIRRSDIFHPSSKQQNFTWPPRPAFDNPIVGLCSDNHNH